MLVWFEFGLVLVWFGLVWFLALCRYVLYGMGFLCCSGAFAVRMSEVAASFGAC